MKVLILTVGSEDDMLQLLKTMIFSDGQHSANVLMCINVLQTLMECLKESHRTRTIFRKVKLINLIFIFIRLFTVYNREKTI